MLLRRNFLNIAAAVSAAFLHVFSLWQLDLINVLPVWNTPLFLNVLQQQGLTVYSEGYFQCFLWKTSVGMAYDVLFTVNFASFWLLFLALWFWKEEPNAKVVFVGNAPFVRLRQDKWRKLARVGVWFGFALALAGSFEQALQSGNPIWSSIFGFPILHHYLIGFLILAVSLLIIEFRSHQLKNG